MLNGQPESSRIYHRIYQRTRFCRSVASWRLRCLILSAYPRWRALEAVLQQPGTSFCRLKISTFMSKFRAKETTDRFWVKYFHGAVKILLILRSFICCGRANDCRTLPPIY